MRSLLRKIPGVSQYFDRQQLKKNLQTVDVDSLHQQMQKLLLTRYQADARQGIRTYQDIAEAGFRCYSQFEEDGILLYILSVIGMKTRKVVEVCCGIGAECMAANLILNHGYQGFLFDGNRKNIRHAQSFFAAKQDCLLAPPTVRQAWITRENINQILRDAGASGEVDLLSLDLDGNDYYIWDAISEINPRLCVFETHNVIPANLSLTIPYTGDFYCWKKQGAERDFRSVSLLAMKKLSEAKGYRLIGAHRHGFNVFFLRNGIAQAEFPEVTIEHVHDNPFTRQAQAERWPPVKDMDWKQI
jgi:hypothetical protein